MKNYQEQLTNYLPEIEKYLTSVLLEETKIEITSFETVETGAFLESMDKDDIFILTRDEVSNSDVICILDKHWFAILSSIMLGIDESSFNEVTKDLLKKFSSELSTTLSKKMTEDGFELDLLEMEVLTLKHLEEKLSHTEYFFGLMEVEGLLMTKLKLRLFLETLKRFWLKKNRKKKLRRRLRTSQALRRKTLSRWKRLVLRKK